MTVHGDDDVSLLARLNDSLDITRIRTRGSVVLPGLAGTPVRFDLGKPYRDIDVLTDEYWAYHPRFAFFKTVAVRARVADLGAGSGGLVMWKSWKHPRRDDLRMYAVDVVKGEFFDRYLDYDLVALGPGETKFPDGAFDAVVVSHLIDYVRDPDALIREIARIARAGCRVFVEWPTVRCETMFGKRELELLGIPCGSLSFSDDAARVAPVAESDLIETFERAGFTAVANGDISNAYLFPELFRCGFDESNAELLTYALWLAYGLARYLIVEKRTGDS